VTVRLLPEILRDRAAGHGDRQAYVFLDEHGTEKAVLSYADLHERALAIAERLHHRSAPGNTALLVFPQSLDFIAAYFGCLYANIIAVPVNPPRNGRVQDATRSIVADCAPAVVLTTEAMLDTARLALAPHCPSAHWLPVDRLSSTVDRSFEPRPSAPDDIAFLQYTSGSTADPKGVLISHRNLIANQEMIKYGFGHDERSTVVGWAPFFHDQGLIGNVLQPLYVGATSILMSPTAFIRWPILWLSAISRYRAHTSGGPNFAYEVCAARAARGNLPELDLSCWQVAFNGAEPIRAETLRRFTDAFAPFGFSDRAHYPCYGLAESTLIVTGSRRQRGARTVDADTEALGSRRYVPGTGRTLVGSGTVLPGEDLRIVDPDTGLPCPPDAVGEIWVAGDHVAQGYRQRPEATAATFHAELAGRRYLRTGDLGVLVDEELYVVGRLKDLLIIRGRNHYPQDIEHTSASAHPALHAGGCAAFSVPGRDGEKLIVVQEIGRDHRRDADAADVTASIRAAITREHQLAVGDIVLTAPSQLQKTSSGKIRRAAARERYLAADFKLWTTNREDART
jgi:acyl-CoA synthetase (AMP-forming)/AMP-acid ligase II